MLLEDAIEFTQHGLAIGVGFVGGVRGGQQPAFDAFVVEALFVVEGVFL